MHAARLFRLTDAFAQGQNSPKSPSTALRGGGSHRTVEIQVLLIIPFSPVIYDSVVSREKIVSTKKKRDLLPSTRNIPVTLGVVSGVILER